MYGLKDKMKAKARAKHTYEKLQFNKTFLK